MATTTYDEYVQKGNVIFVGSDLSINNKFIINYNGTDYTITMPDTMPESKYNSFEGGKFVEDLNTAIANAEPGDPSSPPLQYLVKASLENGEILFRGAREFKLLPASGNSMDVKDIMGIDYEREAVYTKVIVSDIDDIDKPTSHGAQEYQLKAAGSFGAITAGDEFIIYYGDYEYTVKMDRDYTDGEDKEFIYDFNKKLAEDPDLADLKGHLKLYEKDGKFAISADKKFRIEENNFKKLGFEEGTSGLKSVKIAHSIQGGEIKLFDSSITITDEVNDKLYLVYGGKGYTVDLPEKEYDGTSGNTFNDLINDIQAAINKNAELKGYVTATGNDGKIQINADSEFKLTYGVVGDFDGIIPPPTSAAPLVIDNNNDKFDIRLGSGSIITVKLEQDSYNSLDDFTNAIQTAIDSDMYTRGRITVDNNGTDITFYSDLPIALSPAANSALLDSGSSSSSDLMDSLSFNTAKQSSLIDKRVESGSATQLIGMLDRLISDLNNSNTEGISKALTRLDANINNLNAIRAEMGVKCNRFELTKNR